MVDGLAGLFTIFIILGGIISGLFTATEAGAVAALYAIILCCGVYRETKWRELPKLLFECCQVNAVVLFLVATSSVFTWVLTYENLPKMLATTVFNITDNKFLLLIVINIFLLIVGCLVDLTPAVIMLTPILLPLMVKMEMHIVHFGAMMIINLCYGLITPPVGTSLFVGLRISGLSMNQIIRPLPAAAGDRDRDPGGRHLLAAAHDVAAPDVRVRDVERPLDGMHSKQCGTPALLCARAREGFLSPDARPLEPGQVHGIWL